MRWDLKESTNKSDFDLLVESLLGAAVLVLMFFAVMVLMAALP